MKNWMRIFFFFVTGKLSKAQEKSIGKILIFISQTSHQIAHPSKHHKGSEKMKIYKNT